MWIKPMRRITPSANAPYQARGLAGGINTPKTSLGGGVVGAVVSSELQSAGMRDTHAGIVGGGIGGFSAGFAGNYLNYNALRGGAMGGLAGLSGAALSAAIAEILRAVHVE